MRDKERERDRQRVPSSQRECFFLQRFLGLAIGLASGEDTRHQIAQRMGAAAGTLRGGDCVEQLQCHGCGSAWAATAAARRGEEDAPANQQSYWACVRCTLNNEPTRARCAACDTPRKRSSHAGIALSPLTCPSCHSEFVERVSIINTAGSGVLLSSSSGAPDLSVQELLLHMAEFTTDDDSSASGGGGGGAGAGGGGSGSPDSTVFSMALALSLARQYEASAAAASSTAGGMEGEEGGEGAAGTPGAGPAAAHGAVSEASDRPAAVNEYERRESGSGIERLSSSGMHAIRAL